MGNFSEAAISLYKHYVVVLLSASLSFSISTIGIKILSDSVSVFQILLVRALFVGGVAGYVIHRGKEKCFGEKETHGLLLARAVVGSLSFITTTMTTFLLPLADAAFLINIYPVFTAILAYSLRMDKPTIMSCVAIFGCFLSTGLIIRPPFIFSDDDKEWDFQRCAGVLVAVFCQICFSVTTLLISKIGSSATPSSHCVVQSIGTVFISTPFLATPFPKSFKMKLSLGEVGLFIVVCFSGLSFQSLLVKGFQLTSPTKATILFLTNMLYSAGFGIIVRGDDFYYGTFIGAALLAASVLLVTNERSKERPVVAEDFNDDNNAKLLVDTEDL